MERLKIYLDWNVFTQLKEPVAEPYISLKKELTENSDKIFLVCSPSHIDNLSRGWDGSEEKDNFTRKDLRFLGEITSNNMIWFYHDTKKVEYIIREPEKIFDDNPPQLSSSLVDLFNFSKLLEGIEIDSETKAKLDEQLNALNSIKFEGMPDEKVVEVTGSTFATQILPRNGQNAMDFLRQFAGAIESMMKNHDVYKDARSTIHKGFNLNPQVISTWDNVFENIDNHIQKTEAGKKLNEVMAKNNSGDSFFDQFYAKYTSLDMFGFRPEKLTPKNGFSNMTTDAFHAFYGAYGKYFVTADKITLSKSKVVYDYFGITTQICNPEGFIQFLRVELSEKQGADS